MLSGSERLKFIREMHREARGLCPEERIERIWTAMAAGIPAQTPKTKGVKK